MEASPRAWGEETAFSALENPWIHAETRHELSADSQNQGSKCQGASHATLVARPLSRLKLTNLLLDYCICNKYFIALFSLNTQWVYAPEIIFEHFESLAFAGSFRTVRLRSVALRPFIQSDVMPVCMSTLPPHSASLASLRCLISFRSLLSASVCLTVSLVTLPSPIPYKSGPVSSSSRAVVWTQGGLFLLPLTGRVKSANLQPFSISFIQLNRSCQNLPHKNGEN